MNLQSVRMNKYYNEWMNEKVINEPAKCVVVPSFVLNAHISKNITFLLKNFKY